MGWEGSKGMPTPYMGTTWSSAKHSSFVVVQVAPPGWLEEARCTLEGTDCSHGSRLEPETPSHRQALTASTGREWPAGWLLRCTSASHPSG